MVLRRSTYQAGKDGTTFTTDPALTAGTYTYSVTATANGCETVRNQNNGNSIASGSSACSINY